MKNTTFDEFFRCMAYLGFNCRKDKQKILNYKYLNIDTYRYKKTFHTFLLIYILQGKITFRLNIYILPYYLNRRRIIRRFEKKNQKNLIDKYGVCKNFKVFFLIIFQTELWSSAPNGFMGGGRICFGSIYRRIISQVSS